MPGLIKANRDVIGQRHPLLGFSVRTGDDPWFEVVIATEPSLLSPDRRAARTATNFYSSRAQGPLPAEDGRALYILPPEVLLRFVGQERFFYTVATFPDRARSKISMSRVPLGALPSVRISEDFQRGPVRRLIGAGNGHTSPRVAPENGSSMEWAGDDLPPGSLPAPPDPAEGPRVTFHQGPEPGSPVSIPITETGNGSPGPAPGRPGAGNGNDADSGTPRPLPANGETIEYDDGLDAALWSQPQGGASRTHAPSLPGARSLAIVRPDYVPSTPLEAIATIWEFMRRYARWRAGVPDTRIYPHSAICQMVMSYPDGDYLGTGFYIDNDHILTCAHNVRNAATGAEPSSILITPGKNGATAPFGSFTASQGDWEVHPQYNGSFDHDLAVIRVGTPPPNGFYFDVLEDLTQSIAEQIVVCGYAAETGDEDKQNLDGDTVRDVSANLERIQYNLQTEPGNSGSPVFYLTGVEDAEQQMSVAIFPVIGVHVSAYDGSLNQACRLSAGKIAWIRSVGHGTSTLGHRPTQSAAPAAHGRSGVSGAAHHQATQPRGGVMNGTHMMSDPGARQQQVAAAAGAIAGVAFDYITSNEGGVSWNLAQWRGVKNPWDQADQAGPSTWDPGSMNLGDWPKQSTVLGLDEIYLPIEIRWQYNGRSVANVEVLPGRPNDAFAAGLHVEALLMNDENAYESMLDPSLAVAAIKMSISYRFTNTIWRDSLGRWDISLYGDGDSTRSGRWL